MAITTHCNLKVLRRRASRSGLYLRGPQCTSLHIQHSTRSLSVDAAKTLVQAFISSRFYYCNALLYGVSDGLMRRLQSVQNAAARLVTGARRRDHITPILRQLHWLPVRQRVTFKIAVLVFQCLTGQAPTYLADDCQLTSDVSTRRLRSTDRAMCVVRRSNNSFGDGCFAAAGPAA